MFIHHSTGPYRSGIMAIMCLRARVLRAFGQLSYPGDGLLPKDDSDDSSFAISNLAGKEWQNLRHADLAPSHDEALGALSAVGFQYFLPGLLLLCIDDPEGSTTLAHAIVGRFTALEIDSADCVARKEQRIATLTAEQRQVLSMFFESLEATGEHCPELLADASRNVTTGVFRITSE